MRHSGGNRGGIMQSPQSGRSGRAARQAQRAQRTGGLGRPYILRNIPTYDILSEESLTRIETAADRILAETGIDFRDDPTALALWRRAGADVQGVRVKFPPGMLREILAQAPPVFTQAARNRAHSVQIGGKSVVFAPAYGSPFVMDLDRGRRFGTLEDFRNFIKLAQSSPNFHHSGGTICEPTDIAVNKRHLDMMLAHFTLSDRPVMGSVTAEERAEDSIDMARIVFGQDFTENNCVILGNVNVNSPLVWDGTMTRSLRAYARANQAAVVVPFILGGAMGPPHQCGGDCAIFGRNHGGLRFDAAGAPRRAGDLWQFPVQHVDALGQPHLWHARACDWQHGHWAIGAAAEPAVALQRQFHHQQAARCPGNGRGDDVHAGGHSLRGEFHFAFCGVSGRVVEHVL
jgi:hypothetical protein